jgi:hypothetical protein
MTRRLTIALSVAGACVSAGLIAFGVYTLLGRELVAALILAVCAGVAHAVLHREHKNS